MAKKILINYANDAFKKAQKLNSKTGIEIGNFDKVIEYSPKDIDKQFYEKNEHILKQIRGGGYWLWKPYIILKTLMRKDIKDGDYIFYADSGSYFIDKIDYLVDLSKKYKQDILGFGGKGENSFLEKYWTKKDAFILMGLDCKKYTNTLQRGAGFILLKKSELSARFFKEFLKYAQDKRIITDMPSTLGKDYPEFIENRHDQTIFSLLYKKYNLKIFRRPCTKGKIYSNLFSDKYPPILEHSRQNNRNFIQKILYQKSFSKNNFDFTKKLSRVFFKNLKIISDPE